jgi:hypothetical protein
MALTFRRSNASTTSDAIEEFERSRGIKLPKAYKSFLLATNGGVPDRAYYPIKGMELNSYGGVQVFFGLGVLGAMESLEEIYELYVNGFPLGIVPIADNGGGDYISLDLRSGGDLVVFWDKRHFWSTGKWREQDLYRIADSFELFLSLLRPTPS